MDTAREPVSPDRASAYTIPLLCAGIALIACCMLIPASDENRRLAYEREKLRRDLEQIQKQVSAYDGFLKQVAAGDPVLLERLAQKQMRMVRQGTSVLELKGISDNEDLSPFPLLTVPPPAELPPYRPVGGVFSSWCRQPRPRLFLLGTGMLLVAFGLVIGNSAQPSSL